jgi:hypothetical protein
VEAVEERAAIRVNQKDTQYKEFQFQSSHERVDDTMTPWLMSMSPVLSHTFTSTDLTIADVTSSHHSPSNRHERLDNINSDEVPFPTKEVWGWVEEEMLKHI